MATALSAPAPTPPGGLARRPDDDRFLRTVLVSVLVGLNVADLLSTRIVLALGGAEGNPLVRPFVDGMWGVVLAKFAVLVLVAVLTLRTRSRRLRVGLALVDLWYVGVVGWNLHLLGRL